MSDTPLIARSYRTYQDDIRAGVDAARTAGLAAARSVEKDGLTGWVKLCLHVPDFNEITLCLIEQLRFEGWQRTDGGIERMICLPPNIASEDAFTPALAYAEAFKETLREWIAEPIRFDTHKRYS